MPEYLFVYGTLMRASVLPMAITLSEQAYWMGEAVASGRLYDLGDYPGFVPSTSAADRVHGELFALPATPDALLAALDDYEGCGVDDPAPHPYARRLIEVVQDDARMAAWTYVYLLPVAQSQLISGGRFASKSP